MWRIILKRILIISILLIVLALTGVVVHAVLRWVVSATLGRDIVQSAAFYLAVVALSLTLYFCLIVLATKTWGKLRKSLQMRYSKLFRD